jgi:G3E family GTPase
MMPASIHAYPNNPKSTRMLTLGRNCQAHARLDAVITVVDAKHVVQHLDEKKADGAENECVEQVTSQTLIPNP